MGAGRAPRRAVLPLLGGRGLVSPLSPGWLGRLLRPGGVRSSLRRGQPGRTTAGLDPGLPPERLPLLSQAPLAIRGPSADDAGRDWAPGQPDATIRPGIVATAPPGLSRAR